MRGVGVENDATGRIAAGEFVADEERSVRYDLSRTGVLVVMILGGFGVAMGRQGQGGQKESGGWDLRKWWRWEKGEGEKK